MKKNYVPQPVDTGNVQLPAELDELVEKIVSGRLQAGELSQAPLTFKDIDTIKSVFKKRLKAIYHTRISYPNEKKNKK
jgi:membrane-associated HD superfamily phosphohydrolase